jgi:hypothetical protein
MEIQLRNKQTINLLNSFVDEFYSIRDRFLNDGYEFPREKHVGFDESKLEEYCSSDMLFNKHLPNWKKHSGFPKEHTAIPIKQLAEKHSDYWLNFVDKWREQYANRIGANQPTLTNYYSDYGLVGWHTNYASAGFQIVLSWSEKGNGAFYHYDAHKNKIVELKDKPGWQARWYMFAPKTDDPKDHCWHAMWTRCDRFTLCYNWTIRDWYNRESLKNSLLDYVEELETE